MKIIAIIPARLGSQRLKQKNLQPLHGVPLIAHAIRKAKVSKIFDAIWVNSEADIIGQVAKDEVEVLLSVENVQIECAYQDKPINFTYNEKTNSQELDSIQRITWSITGWKRDSYIKAYEAKECATYSGKVGYLPINKLAAHIIKTQKDLDIAEALYRVVNQ